MIRALAVAFILLAGATQAADAPTSVPLEIHADGSVLLEGRLIRYQHRVDANFHELATHNPKPVLRLSLTANVTPEILARILEAAARGGLSVDQSGVALPKK